MDVPSQALALFWTVIFLRFLLPLLIPKYPLPAILACLALDAVDQPLFQTYTSVDLSGYQAYDKALDIFYLSIAMFATLRNWASYPATQIARALFYWRLVGVVAFELTGWRVLLILFPNTFEYFFIYYEMVRSRWSVRRMGKRDFIAAAALITLLVKMPQEYWIHVAQLDVTDVLKTNVLGASIDASWGHAISGRPVAFVLVIIMTVGLCALVAHLVRRVLGAPTHALRLVADPVPARIDEASERDRRIAEAWHLFDLHLLEKIVLVGFVTVIFARIVPGVHASPVQLVSAVTIIVTINAFLRLRSARAGQSRESMTLSFVALAVTNAAIVAIADRLLRQGNGGLSVTDTAFFLLLLTLIVTLYDRWRPVFDVRFGRRVSS